MNPTNIINAKIRKTKKWNQLFPAFLIIITLIQCIIWIQLTNFTEDDAFITFRFAEQLANGNGFVYNQGEPIYGTTTPLFTFLLAIWIRFISPDVILGARLFGVLALLGTELFIWFALKELNRSTSEQIFVLAAITFSSKMIYMSIYGMEIPLVTLFLSLSWFLLCKRKYFWSGIVSGFLVFTRLDLALWPFLVFIFLFFENKKTAFVYLLGTSLIYLPWVIFAFIQFDSPIPYTMIAKWTAYSRNNFASFGYHLRTILAYISPFSLTQKYNFVGPVILLAPILWLIFFNKKEISKPIFLLLLFAVMEVIKLTLTRASIFSRYFIPTLWVVLILFGISIGIIWQSVKMKTGYRYSMAVLLTLLLIGVIVNESHFISYVKARQLNRYEHSLKLAGIWLNENSPESSTVLLEPLGYVGYYSKRTMLDEVGLITPQVVALAKQDITSDQFLKILGPDYAVYHCDDADFRANQPDSFLSAQYQLVQEYNPLNFQIKLSGQYDDPYDQIRNSCYQIWESKRFGN